MTGSPFSYRRATTFPEQISLMARVVVALVLRESKTRYGRNRLGFLWALIEPLVFVGLFLLIRGGLRDRNIPFGQDLALFLVTGLLAFRMFLSIASRGMGAIVSNSALIAYPPVKPLDTIIARVLLEVLTMYFVWTVCIILLSVFVEGKVITSHVEFVEAMAALTYLSLSVATFNGVVAVLWPTWERLWGFIRLPLLILSGIFFLPSSMPLEIQEIMSWNPVLHAVEWIRTSIYLTYEPMLSVSYLLGFSTVTLCVALVLERAYRYKIYG